MATLPQLTGDDVYLTDGGLETTLVFLEGLDLPDFAAFPLLGSAEGKAALDRYYAPYLDLAERTGVGFVLDTPTWRANRDWGMRLGYDDDALAEVNRRAVDYIEGLADARPITDDGAQRGGRSARRRLRRGRADDARGGRRLPLAAGAGLRRRRRPDDDRRHDDVRRGGDRRRRRGLGGRTAGGRSPSPSRPTAGSPPDRSSARPSTRSTRPPTGHRRTSWSTAPTPPTSPASSSEGGSWVERVKGVRANASTMSHAELDEAEELDRGDVAGLARHYAELRRILPDMRVAGGCCGTDAAHISAIADELDA